MFAHSFLEDMRVIIQQIDCDAVEKMAKILADTRKDSGRLFILGVGGSAANASHAVNDFRKITGIETYAPTDNVSELTARTNDEGWASVFSSWLEVSHLKKNDTILVLSVGGGNVEKNVSPNLVLALQYAQKIGSKIIGVVGRDGGYTAQVSDACVIIPTVNAENVTPYTEAMQSVIMHLLVTHPELKINKTKWEVAK